MISEEEAKNLFVQALKDYLKEPESIGMHARLHVWAKVLGEPFLDLTKFVTGNTKS